MERVPDGVRVILSSFPLRVPDCSILEPSNPWSHPMTLCKREKETDQHSCHPGILTDGPLRDLRKHSDKNL